MLLALNTGGFKFKKDKQRQKTREGIYNKNNFINKKAPRKKILSGAF
ncbi:MAG: hypothetical protein PHG02_00735 [Oscillospiraceae bacterium]|nr:hypothetical protein [Oscillospiraceae bacterium]